jgi:hypothetical protein
MLMSQSHMHWKVDDPHDFDFIIVVNLGILK